ncbi:hypothetical protein LZ31DRAFT_331878 [Colletotrichum somersetense]|nr:hypothetical protein LZ31DRAFT_331878 [Colletotrichum somersetense]
MFVSLSPPPLPPPSPPDDVQQLARQRRQAREASKRCRSEKELMPGTIYRGGGPAESLTFPDWPGCSSRKRLASPRLVLSE